jgi:uncharacterized delta-60 repeat protein
MKHLMNHFLLGAIWVVCVHPAGAAVVEDWVHRYSAMATNSVDEGKCVAVDSRGDVIVAGESQDGIGIRLLLVKYSRTEGRLGSLQWIQSLFSPPPGVSFYEVQALALDAADNVLVCGGVRIGTNRSDYFTAKFAGADGAVLWERHLDNSSGWWDSAEAVVADGTGGVIVTGYSHDRGESDFSSLLTAKYRLADGTLLWERRHGGKGFISAFLNPRADLALDRDGNILIAGVMEEDGYVAKLGGLEGDLRWESRYDGPEHRHDEFRVVKIDAQGDVAVAGATYHNGQYPDSLCAKYSGADGSLLWERRYDGPAHGGDQANAVGVDAEGHVFIAGLSSDGFVDDYYIAKYNGRDGAILWEQRYDKRAYYLDRNHAHRLVVDSQGDLVVAGTSASTETYYRTLKYSGADGRLLWDHSWGYINVPAIPPAIALQANDDVMFVGRTAYGHSDFYTERMAARDGATTWERRYDGFSNKNDIPVAVAMDAGGNVVVTGYSQTGDHDDIYSAKYAVTDGSLLWERRYDGPDHGQDRPVALALDKAGDVIICGTTGPDWYCAKYAGGDGRVLWERQQPPPESSKIVAVAMALDGEQRSIALAARLETDATADFFILKLEATDGRILWQRRYDGPAKSWDGVTDIAFDHVGNVVATGTTENTNRVRDYYTIKCAAGDGMLIWDKVYRGPASADPPPTSGVSYRGSEAKAVAIDSQGDVLVTGISGKSTDQDYCTIKYAGIDGRVLWEVRYDGPRSAIDDPRAIVVDTMNNVVVTGVSAGLDSDYDFYTAKYLGTSGALLWEKRFNGPQNSHDGPKAIKMDGRGNVIVTGFTEDRSGWGDYQTLKYSGDNGEVLWQISYDSGGGDGPVELATHLSGLVAVCGASTAGPWAPGPSDFLTIMYREIAAPTLEVAVSTQSVLLRCLNLGPGSATVLRSTDLRLWTVLGIVGGGADGVGEFVDPSPLQEGAFFQVRQP